MNTRKDRFVAAFQKSGVKRIDLAATSGVDPSTIYRWTTGAAAEAGALQKCEEALVIEIGKIEENCAEARSLLLTPVEGDK